MKKKKEEDEKQKCNYQNKIMENILSVVSTYE